MRCVLLLISDRVTNEVRTSSYFRQSDQCCMYHILRGRDVRENLPSWGKISYPGEDTRGELQQHRESTHYLVVQLLAKRSTHFVWKRIIMCYFQRGVCFGLGKGPLLHVPETDTLREWACARVYVSTRSLYITSRCPRVLRMMDLRNYDLMHSLLYLQNFNTNRDYQSTFN